MRKNASSPAAKVSAAAASPSASRAWQAQYETDYAAQKSSGPIVFTEEQRAKNREVLSRVSDLLPFEDAYKATDCDLIYRFLISKHWNVGLAEKGLREYMDLRRREHLDGLIGEQLHPTIGAVLCPCYGDGTPCPIYGLDKDGLPVLWLSPDAAKVIAAMKQFTDVELLRGQMRAIELGRFVCRARGVDRCTYVIDLGGITMSSVNKATLGFLKGVMNMLQVAYPEIMRRLLIFNTGWAVSAGWKVLRPLVDVRVQDKIKFESGAPSLAALQPYMDADQVHPAFGGTGKGNCLDAMIDAEMRRVRGQGEDALPSESAASVRGPSVATFDEGSLFDVDPHALHSFYSVTPGTAPQSPSELFHNTSPNAAPALDRMVIGAPRAVSAWMAHMGEEGDARDALDMSLSVASSSNDYAVDRTTEEAVAAARTLPHNTRSPLTNSSQQSRRASAAGPSTSAAPYSTATAAPSSSSSEPYAEGASGDMRGAQETDQLPIIAMSLTYGADGSITGYCGQQCAGHFRSGCLYASPRESSGSFGSPRVASPATARPASLPNSSGATTKIGGVNRAQRDPLPSPTSQRNPPTGELLYEAGHPIHNFFIVCDGQRHARYLLRRSRLRTRLSVFNVLGGAVVRTEKNNRHYVEGERARLGVAVPSTDPTSNSKGDWMLFGEDVTQRTPKQHLKHFFSKVKKNTVPVAGDGSGSNGADNEKDAGWPASMLAAIRTTTASAVSSPSKRKAKTLTEQQQQQQQRAADDASSAAAATTPHGSVRKPVDAEDDSPGAQLLAENRGQTVYFYHLLTKSPLPDLFALAVAITLSWSGELEGLKDRSTSKAKRYASDEEELMI